MQAKTKQPKVTLTNWERLNNALLPLAGASAVQWNDHMFVLGHNGITLLYHTKSKIWSVLPTAPYTSTNTTPPPLTSHNGQILTMSKGGQMATYNPELGDWTKLKDMNLKTKNDWDCKGCDRENCVLVSYNSDLYAISDFEKPETDSLYFLLTDKKCCTIHLYDPQLKSWIKVCEFGQSSLQSAAIIGETAFVHTGEEMYKVALKQKQEKTAFQLAKQKPSFSPPMVQIRTKGISLNSKQAPQLGTSLFQSLQTAPTIGQLSKNTPIKIASPPYEGFTLYAIKNTLFSFGGRDRDNQPTSDVLRYNPDTDTWESAGYMRSARYNVAVTTMQDTTEVFVVGGSFGSSHHTIKKRTYTSSAATGFSTSTIIWESKTNILEKCTVN